MSQQLFVVSAVLLSCATVAAAQDAPAFRPGQLIVSGGGSFERGYLIGDLTVTIPRNPSGGSTPFTLLRSESRIGSVAGVDVRVAYALTPKLALEARGAYATPELRVTISQDDELGGGASARERVQQYSVDVGAIYQLPFDVSRRARTYVIGGAGYLRQLHEGRLLVETGQTIHAGAGVLYWLRGPRPVPGRRVLSRTLGVRGEARFVSRFGGIDFEDRSRSFPAVSALVFVGF